MKSSVHYVSILFIIVIFDCSCVFSEFLGPLDNAGEVVLTSILYRHGERTPEEPFPNDPYKNESLWPVEFGQLTNPGKLQHYHLGQWFRNRYNHLIPGGKYDPRIIYIQSTDMDRTLMSAQSNLAGMFPPTSDQSWSDIPWQPIPVHTVPKHLDKVLSMGYPCPKYSQEKAIALKSKEVLKFNAQYKELFQYLTENAGKLVDDCLQTEYLYSNLYIEEINNFTLPNWTASVFPDKMKHPAAFSFAIPTLTKKMKRLKSGPLLKEMITHMRAKKSGNLSPNRNIFVYSGHDTTVANLLSTLGVFELHTPPFIATVVVELRRNIQKEHFVTVYYKNSTAEPTLMTIPGCEGACPFDKFVSLLADVTPDNWDSECHSHQLFDLTSDQPYNSLAIFAMVTSTLLVFLLLASTSLYWHKQKPVHLYKKLKMETL